MRVPHSILVVGRVALLAYLGMLVLLALGQRRFIYIPSRGSPERLGEQALREGLKPWLGGNGEYVGWRVPPRRVREATNTLVVFHGNAGQAINRTYLADGFQMADHTAAWEVFLFEYPGFGMKSGKPSEGAIMAGAEEALEELLREGRRVFLLGESLGGGVACGLAARYPDDVDGLVLLTPFTRLADVARHHYPIFPVRLFLRDRYDNVKALRSYQGPVAVLLAERDEVVPTRFGRKLYEGYEGPKKLWVQPGTHNTLDYRPGQPWWNEVIHFVTKEHDAH